MNIVEAIRLRRVGKIEEPALLAQISIFNDAWSTEPIGASALVDVLADIRQGRWKERIAAARKALKVGDEGVKKALPAFTMSALLTTRQRDVPLSEKLIAHSGWLQIDIDCKDNPQLPLPEIIELLRGDPHVGFGFISPSGRGVKCGVLIDETRHLESFLTAEDYFARKHSLKIDPATKDITRLCFISHDPEAWIRTGGIARLDVPADSPNGAHPAQASRASLPPGAQADSAEDIREMLAFIPPHPDYMDWLRIASAVWSVLDFIEGTRALVEWSPEEHPGEYAKKYQKRLKTINLATLVWYAQQNGFDAREAARRKRWCGRIRFGTNASGVDNEIINPLPPARTDGPNSGSPETDTAWQLRVWQGIENQQQGDARLWADYTDGMLHFDAYKKGWFRYDAGIWGADDLCTIRNEMVDNLTAIYQPLKETIEDELQQNPPKPKAGKKEKDDPRVIELKTILGRIGKLRQVSWSNGSLTFAQELPEFACRPSDFDQGSHLLVTENKTIDFKTHHAREHRPEDRQLSRAPVKYDPDARCPKFNAFLDQMMGGDQELVDYLWRAIGYSLTGYTDADVVFLCYGTGANGKSTFNSTIAMLMGGGLHTVVDIETFLSTGRHVSSDLDYKKSMLEGKRHVVTDEVPDGRQLNEAVLKKLTGGDEITARRPYQLPYTFQPTHKLWITGNHKPDIRGTDEAIWRRIHLIPWEVTIPPEARRPRSEILGEFRMELAGILNRAMEGCVDYKVNGLAPPSRVLAATQEYRDSSDQLGQFLKERTECKINGRVKATDLLKAFLAWCEDNNEIPVCRGSRRLLARLRERGISDYIGHGKVAFIEGLIMKNPETDPEKAETDF